MSLNPQTLEITMFFTAFSIALPSALLLILQANFLSNRDASRCVYAVAAILAISAAIVLP